MRLIDAELTKSVLEDRKEVVRSDLIRYGIDLAIEIIEEQRLVPSSPDTAGALVEAFNLGYKMGRDSDE